MFNTTTTPNANRTLWTAASKGKQSAQAAVRRLRKQDRWTAEIAADLLAGYDRCLALTEPGTPDHYRWAAARAFVIAARPVSA